MAFSVDSRPDLPDQLSFATVRHQELERLASRRSRRQTAHNRPDHAGLVNIAAIGEATDGFATFNTVGLAISGGGIRSATFALGVLQGLGARNLIGQFDYLSTVSGGGYIGAALSSTLQQSHGQFVFGGPGVFRDTDSVGHLRNYSNYLLPRNHSALRNASEVAAVVGRGLVANLLITTGVILLLALLTFAAYPERCALHGSFPIELGTFVKRLLSTGHPVASACPRDGILRHDFGTTLGLGFITVLAEACWAVLRSRASWKGGDVSGPYLTLVRALIVTVAIAAFLDVQPLAIDLYLRVDELPAWVRHITTSIVLPAGVLGTVVTFLSGQLATFLHATQAGGRRGTTLKRIGAQLLVLIAAIFVPLMLYVEYLALSARLLGSSNLWLVYLLIAAVMVVVAAAFSPNGNSLHRFYRDRLSKAFLFEQVSAATPEHRAWSWRNLVVPRLDEPPAETRVSHAKVEWTQASAPVSAATQAPRDTKLVPRDPVELPELDSDDTPYHLLNTTLNLQGSLHANKRGRDCDFFVFTPKHYGGELLGYYDVRASDVDLATAVAISGAAASSAMGGLKLFKALAPTLALLNVRLGYWLANPRTPGSQTVAQKLIRRAKKQFYLLTEALLKLDETSADLYLTDGGHIENLGVYELLRRGCKLIVVIDGEADPTIACGSLISVERYARIDFGTRIDIDTRPIAVANAAIDGALDAGQALPRDPAPHYAIGRILYPNGTTGVLLYIKAALSGDEPDYVLQYKRSYPDFPHESTGDQFFSEDQFESYRALGFHSVEALADSFDAGVLGAGGYGIPHDLPAVMWRTLLHHDEPVAR